ncbi:MAG TPA: hypothetical protein VFB38_10265 [Chthonomonadaceae bacterium]|nr:hypothetical protein [Chthonomonadaceae bacterium]
MRLSNMEVSRTTRSAGRRNVVRWGLCALLLLPLMAYAGQGANGPFLLRMRFKQGEINKYRTMVQATMTMTQPNQPQPMTIPITMNMVQEQKVLRADPNGGGEVIVTLMDQHNTLGTQPMVGQNIPPLTLRFDPLGRATSIKGIPANNPASNMLNGPMNVSGLIGVGVSLPARAVKPGDKWTQPISLPGITGVGKATSTFLRVENVGHFRTARIRTRVSIPMNMLMDARGQPTRSASQAILTMAGSTAMTVDNNLAIAEGKLIKAGGNGVITLAMKPNRPARSGPRPGVPNNMKMRISMNVATELVQ